MSHCLTKDSTFSPPHHQPQAWAAVCREGRGGALLLTLRVLFCFTSKCPATPNTLQLQKTDRGAVLLHSFISRRTVCTPASQLDSPSLCFSAWSLPSLSHSEKSWSWLRHSELVEGESVTCSSLSGNPRVTLRPVQGAAPPSRPDSWARLQHPTELRQSAG